MFGYIVANIDKLNEEDDAVYRSAYCGLCSALGRRHGQLSRATINYDMTFLIILLSSVYEEDWTLCTERCVVHPTKKHESRINSITEYAADMNVVLAYYNFIDDWDDDRSLHALVGAGLLKKEFKKVATTYPDKILRISECLNELASVEHSGTLNPDVPANCFGQLMGELIDYKDRTSVELIQFGQTLGKFIYIMDACIDLKKDLKAESYNPMLTTPSANFSEILNLLAADCVEKYKLLPVSRYRSLIENVLYSGIWTKFEMHKRENMKK